MAGIKGYPAQKKIVGIIDGQTEANSKTTEQWVTVQDLGRGDRMAVDTLNHGVFRIGAVDACESGTTNRKIVATAHGAKKGDVIRFEDNVLIHMEVGVLTVPDANTIILATELPATPAVADQFYVMRHVTPRYDDSGNLNVNATQGPTQYVLNGVDTEVLEDTTTPSNNRPLPVRILSERGSAYITSVRNDYSSVNVTSGAWVQLIASTSAEASSLTLFDSSGYAMELAIGAAASEARFLLVPPGGIETVIPIRIPASSRISVRAISTSATAGEICLNLLA